MLAVPGFGAELSGGGDSVALVEAGGDVGGLPAEEGYLYPDGGAVDPLAGFVFGAFYPADAAPCVGGVSVL